MDDESKRTQLKKLVGLRSIAGVEYIIEWNAGIETAAQVRLADKLDSFLARQYPDGKGDFTMPPVGRIRSGRNRKAQISPGRVNVNTQFFDNYSRDWDLAAKYVRKHWSKILEIFETAGVEPTFLALVWTLKLSMKGFDLRPGDLTARYFDVPGWKYPIEDAEFRVATSHDNRYFVNMGLKTYASQNFTVKTTGERADLLMDTVDKGMLIKIDINTKYNVVNDTGPITVTQQDFERCLELAATAIESELPKFLTE